MRFAFLILGPRFEPERDRAAILDGTAQIVGVPTVEQAARQAERLAVTIDLASTLSAPASSAGLPTSPT